jgi:hypothetical protein
MPPDIVLPEPFGPDEMVTVSADPPAAVIHQAKQSEFINESESF